MIWSYDEALYIQLSKNDWEIDTHKADVSLKFYLLMKKLNLISFFVEGTGSSTKGIGYDEK